MRVHAVLDNVTQVPKGIALGEPYARRDLIADWTSAWRKAVRWQEAAIVQRYTFKSSRSLSCGRAWACNRDTQRLARL